MKFTSQCLSLPATFCSSGLGCCLETCNDILCHVSLSFPARVSVHVWAPCWISWRWSKTQTAGTRSIPQQQGKQLQRMQGMLGEMLGKSYPSQALLHCFSSFSIALTESEQSDEILKRTQYEYRMVPLISQIDRVLNSTMGQCASCAIWLHEASLLYKMEPEKQPTWPRGHKAVGRLCSGDRTSSQKFSTFWTKIFLYSLHASQDSFISA